MKKKSYRIIGLFLGLVSGPLFATPISNGTSATSTGGTDGAVTLLAATQQQECYHIIVTNTGAAAGFFSVDGGVTWIYIPAGPSSVSLDAATPAAPLIPRGFAVHLKRVPSSGTDITGVYAVEW